jgi:hypothetical protein
MIFNRVLANLYRIDNSIRDCCDKGEGESKNRDRMGQTNAFQVKISPGGRSID